MTLDEFIEEEKYRDFQRIAEVTPPGLLYGWGAEVIDGVALCLAEGCGHFWRVEDGLEAAKHECPGAEEDNGE